nr:RNA polymerase alpha subunit C-terminal domain-containing protein [uncultured Dyadobacter sp.]
MAANTNEPRICPNGHRYYKSSDCPTCPVCESERKPKEGFMLLISAPARRALENNGVHTLAELARKTEKQVLAYHGMGPNAVRKLKEVLIENGLSFA